MLISFLREVIGSIAQKYGMQHKEMSLPVRIFLPTQPLPAPAQHIFKSKIYGEFNVVVTVPYR